MNGNKKIKKLCVCCFFLLFFLSFIFLLLFFVVVFVVVVVLFFRATLWNNLSPNFQRNSSLVLNQMVLRTATMKVSTKIFILSIESSERKVLDFVIN